MSPLSPGLRETILARMGISALPSPDLAGLRSIYAAWCLSVPFDNIAKLIALRARPDQPLPGMDATEFFERWLTHGVGGTCWAGSNALCEFLLSLGFNARRVAGSMGDTGYLGHGSVKVRFGHNDWVADSSLLTDVLIPLTDAIFVDDESIFGVESEPVDGSHMIWADVPPSPALTPCRLMIDPSDHAHYVERFEASRARSPFNERLYVRRNLDGARFLLVARTRILKDRDGIQKQELSRDEICSSLIEEFGVSKKLVDELNSCGALEASFNSSPPPPSPVVHVPPSQRINRH